MESNIFFKPRYDKEKYEKGYKGYRTLILGVFHVCRTECKFREDCFKNTAKYDRECPVYKGREEYYSLSNSNEIEVESYLEECDSHYSYSYITKYFFRTNKSVPEDKKRDFWDSIAFTNFLQNMQMTYMTLEYDEKNKVMFDNNIPAFEQLLNELQPEVIYVIDKAVKDCLCAEGNEINGLEFVDSYEDWQVPIYRFTYNIKSKGRPEEILKAVEEEIVQKKVKVKGNLYRNMLENIYKIKDLKFSVKNSVSKEVKELLCPYVWEKEFIVFLMKKDVEIGLKIALRNKLVEEQTTKEKLNSDNKKEKKELEEKYKVNIDIDSLINIIKTSDIPVYSDQYMRDGFMIELFEELDKCLAREEKMNQFNFMNVMGLQDISKCKTQEDWRTKRKPEYKGNKPYINSDGKKEVVINADGTVRPKNKTNKEHLDEMVQNTMIKIKKSLLLAISS